MDSIMKERPILFNAPMVNAILAGNKTQTRRIVKPQPVNETAWVGGMHCLTWIHKEVAGPDGWLMHNLCPLGKVGDRLWLREAFGEVYDWCDHPEMPGCPTERWHIDWKYRADGEVNREELDGAFTGWKPSIHMPRAACRILLEITAVRVERLQDISEEDAEAEGCERLDSERDERDLSICPQCGGTGLHLSLGGGGGVCEVDCNKCNTYKKRYQHLWSSIYGAESWATNPWVWTIEFKRITP